LLSGDEVKLVLVLLLFGTLALAHNKWSEQGLIRDPRGLTLYFQPMNFEASKKNSEYFFEVELQVNYGTDEIEFKIENQLRRLFEVKEEIGSGKLFGAPLLHWFSNPLGTVSYPARNEYLNRIDQKIEALQHLLSINTKLKGQRTLVLRSESVRPGDEDVWIRRPTKFSLSLLYQRFQMRALVDAANSVFSLPSQDLEIGKPLFAQKEDFIDRIKAEVPKMSWQLRVYRRDGGVGKAIVVQEGRGITDLRPPNDIDEPTNVYADFASRRSEEEPTALRILAILDKTTGLEADTKEIIEQISAGVRRNQSFCKNILIL
jgi:hypothetical protein